MIDPRDIAWLLEPSSKKNVSKLSNFILWVVVSASVCTAKGSAVLDNIVFGKMDSEAGHSLKVNRSRLTTNGLGETGRIVLPADELAWDGGRLTFTLAVDPVQQNYATARFWGSDRTV